MLLSTEAVEGIKQEAVVIDSMLLLPVAFTFSIYRAPTYARFLPLFTLASPSTKFHATFDLSPHARWPAPLRLIPTKTWFVRKRTETIETHGVESAVRVLLLYY
jgi:hypothetical protein